MFSIGTMIQFTPDAIYNEDEQDNYRAKIVEFGKSSFFIELPINERTDKTEFFPNDTLLTSRIIHDDGVVYEFPTKLIGRKTDKIPMLELELPKKHMIKKIQRRAFVRVDVIKDVTIIPAEEDAEAVMTSIVNISGGGMCLVVPDNIQIEVDDIFTCQFVIPSPKEKESIEAECQVVRMDKDMERNHEKAFIHFLHINETDRTKIVQFCFRKQLEQRRKGQ